MEIFTSESTAVIAVLLISRITVKLQSVLFQELRISIFFVKYENLVNIWFYFFAALNIINKIFVLIDLIFSEAEFDLTK